MFLIGFPLLLIPFVLYNIFAFIFGVTDWTQPITSVHMRSGGEWGVSPSDLLIAFRSCCFLWKSSNRRGLGVAASSITCCRCCCSSP